MENWGEMLLERLLRERRQMPKEERLKQFRNDSVDEVDTTDLEYWMLRAKPEDPFAIEKATDTFPEWQEINGAIMTESSDDDDEYQNGIKLANEDEMAEHTEYLIIRHRLDVAKLYLNKEGGYSLRKFKKIFKREMAEHPEKYVIMRPGAKFHNEEEIIETEVSETKDDEKPASDVEQLSELSDIDDEAGEV